jgi:O-acetyl-ADP-ribose deacetylase (regulator of RNase III)
MSFPKLILCDLNSDLPLCWKKYFSTTPNVEIIEGDILEVKADAIISPANSFGYMNGGVDQAYLNKWGKQLEDRLRYHISQLGSGGELIVGQGFALRTLDKDDTSPWLIAAPTMRIPPMDLDNTLNPYYAFRAALLVLKGLRNVTVVASPGIGTGTGRACPDMTARQMFAAYQNIVLGAPDIEQEIIKQHAWMLTCDYAKTETNPNGPNTNP